MSNDPSDVFLDNETCSSIITNTSTCMSIFEYRTPYTHTPLAITLPGALMVIQLLICLYRANRNINRKKELNPIVLSEPEMMLKHQAKKGYFNHFYFQYLQALTLVYAVKLIFEAFLYTWKYTLSPTMIMISYFEKMLQLCVIIFLFTPNEIKTTESKLRTIAIASFGALVDFLFRLITRYKYHIPINYVSCGSAFADSWLTYNAVAFFCYFMILVFGSFTWVQARTGVNLYSFVLLALTAVKLLGSVFLSLHADIGFCIWLLDLFLYSIFYPGILYRTLYRDSLALTQRDFDLNRPLLQHMEREVKISKSHIVAWGDLKVGDLVGVGGYGEVYIGYYRSKSVAIKKLFLQDLSYKEMEQFKTEAELLSKMNHPSIIQLVGVCLEAPNVAIVTEYMPRGNLRKLMSNKVLRRGAKLNILKDIASGVKYLHSFDPPIVHRDLKSSNILVGKDFEIKISDLGIAKVLGGESSFSIIGTIPWTAPELLRESPTYNEKVDVYSFGILMWEILTEQLPYEGMLQLEVIVKVTKENLRPSIPESCPNEYRQLMKDCWQDDPDSRPSFVEIVDRFLVVEFDDGIE